MDTAVGRLESFLREAIAQRDAARPKGKQQIRGDDDVAPKILTRVKRAAKELLGRTQAPRREQPRPRSFEQQIYSAIVRPGDVCFDVGANQGDVAIFLSRLAGETGRVVAFEPVWPTFTTLCDNLRWDTHLKAPILTVPAGLADTDGQALIHVPGDAFPMASMARPDRWRDAHMDAPVTSYQARFLTLDSFLAWTREALPDVMKIDVEGAELLVLRGAAGTFAAGARPLLVVEVFAPWERAFGYGPWESLSWLGDRGYRFLFACPSGLIEHVPSPSTPFPAEYEQGYNILAFVPDKHNERVRSLDPLRSGEKVELLPMDPPPMPNRITA